MNAQAGPIASRGGPVPALRSPRAWILLLVVVAVGIAADLATKSLAFQRVAPQAVQVERERVLSGDLRDIIPPHQPRVVVPYVLELTLVLNPGAVFGVGPGKRWFFVLFTVVAVGFGLWIFARWTAARDWPAHLGLGLILAGGLGNLYDRLVFGCVRDFLHPLPNVHLPFGLRWPGGAREVWPWVSNVADALLLIGIALLIWTLWRNGDPKDAPRPGATPPKDAPPS